MYQQLLIDGDDTLWECHQYFEKAIEAFIAFLNHARLTPQEVRDTLNEIEATQGYGSACFTQSLQETYRRLAERVRDEGVQWITALGEQVRDHPIQVISGVRGTLEYLTLRHELILLTKGDHQEQIHKIERSGLRAFFQQVIIVEEKNLQTYIKLIKTLSLDPERTWMIGNSPRSDINPARQADLNAVYIPRDSLWSRERQELSHGGIGRLLILNTFTELCDHF